MDIYELLLNGLWRDHGRIAVPASVATGNRVFTEDDSGLILAAIGAVPTPADEVVEPASGPISTCQTGCVTAAPPDMPSQIEIDAYAAALEAQENIHHIGGPTRDVHRYLGDADLV